MNKGRLFTFGCSFTQYKWATWADILGREFSYFENWALSGMGNQYIFNSLLECNQRKKFNPTDTVIIMWTHVTAEDRYVNRNWLGSGNIYYQNLYSEEWVKQFADDRGYLVRDLATIAAAKQLLDHWQVNYVFLTMSPIDNLNLVYQKPAINDEDVVDMYSEHLEIIKPSMFETEFDFNWYKLDKFEYEFWARKGWPSFEDFTNGSNGAESVSDHVKLFRKQHLLEGLNFKFLSVKKVFDAFVERSKTQEFPVKDHHPKPLQHLSYLEKVLPEFKISDKTKAWVKDKHIESIYGTEDIPTEWPVRL